MRDAARRPAVRRLAATATLLLSVLSWSSAPAAGAGPVRRIAPRTPTAPATLAFRLGDPRLDEISGIATGIRSPGVVYVQNDSGDAARFFALDQHSGAVLASFHVPGATNVDWEDIAVAPDAAGTPSVWLADIGDNTSQRSQVQLYRVDEPRVDLARSGLDRTAAAPQVWHLRYPDGAHDAESLAVSPAGVPYVFTKSVLGDTGVYAAPPRPGRLDTLRAVGQIVFDFTRTPGPFNPVGELAATGADLSRDGTRLVVRTYTDAYLWPVVGGDVAAAVRDDATQRIALPGQPQGEGICFDGARLLIDSEGIGSAVYSIQLPALAAAPPSAAPPVSSSGPSPSAPSSASRPAAAVPGRSGAGRTWWIIGFAVAAAAAMAVGLSLSRRRGPRQDRGA